MSSNSRTGALAFLVFVAFWVADSLVDSLFFSSGNFFYLIFEPSPYEIYIRLLGGGALALGTIFFQTALTRTRRTRDELSFQKEMYQNLVDSGPDCVIVHREMRIVFINRNTLNFFDLKDGDKYAGVSVLDFIIPEYHGLVESTTTQILAGQTSDPLTLGIRKPDGSIRDIQATNALIDWSGQPAVLTFFRDITEEISTRQDLITSRERLQLALDAARDGVWDWDITSGRMVYNEAWANLVGYSLTEISDNLDTWRNLIHPDDYQRAQTLVDSHLKGTIPGYEIEVRLRHKKGHYLWVLDRGKVVERDPEGNPLRMTGTHRNITARKEAELALEIRNRVAEAFLTQDVGSLFSQILEVIGHSLGAPIGLFTTLGPKGNLHVLATNPDIQGKPSGMEQSPLFPRTALPEVFDTVIIQNRSLIRNEPLEIPTHIMPLTSILGVPISSRDNVLGAIFIGSKPGGFQVADQYFLESLAGYIAPLLQAHLQSEAKEAQLRQAQKMEALGALAGGIAHDFNNILQAIMGFTTLALEDADPEGNIPKDLQRVLKATHRGQDLVQRILLFSRRDEQKHEPVEVQPLVTEAINLLKPSLPATIEIRSHLEAPEAKVYGDAGQISQIIFNLATNAYHAMEIAGGVLDFRLHTMAPGELVQDCPKNLVGTGLVILSLADTGTGMTEQVKARIFDPFFTTKAVGQGTGLGLSMVHGIVKAHGGEIRITSEFKQGTTVTVFLPMYMQENAASPPEPESQATPHHPLGLRIVLVDDELDIIETGKALLERMGHRVTTESDGLRVLGALENDPQIYDLVITDLTMPHITGLQLAERLEKIRPELPIILITGMSKQQGITLDAHANIKGVIRKPFGGNQLRLEIDRVLEESLDQGET